VVKKSDDTADFEQDLTAFLWGIFDIPDVTDHDSRESKEFWNAAEHT
jgi:hypothetical protein